MAKARNIVSMDFKRMASGEERISVFDRGFLFGDSVYEVLRTYGLKLFALKRHFLRLERSAGALGFELPFDEAGLEAHLDEMVAGLGVGDCFVRVIVTRGAYDVSLYPPGEVEPCTVVIAGELPAWPREHYETGISLVTVGIERNARDALNPMIKSGNYLNNVLAAMEARRAGAVDAVMLNASGHVTESSTANIFIVQDGALITPPVEAGILDGVLRHTVLELAARDGIDCRETLFGTEAFGSAEECFITSTTREVMPVRLVDQVELPAPGPVTKGLMQSYKDFVKS